MTVTHSTVAAPRSWGIEALKADMTRQPTVWIVAFLVALVHGLTADRYDAQRNELYFLACGWHPDFGYVDQPPLVPLIGAATQIFGVNIWMLRLPATVAAIAMVFLAASFARLLGRGNRAAAFAAIAVSIAPGLAGLASHLTTSTFEPIAWTCTAFLLARAHLHDRRTDLILTGVVAGLAMEAKWGIAIFLIALGVGVLATSARRMLTGRNSHLEQIWSATPQIADIDCSRDDFSVGPQPDSRMERKVVVRRELCPSLEVRREGSS